MFRFSDRTVDLRNEKLSNMKIGTEVLRSFDMIKYMNAIKDINEIIRDAKAGLDEGYAWMSESYDERERAEFQESIDILEQNVSGLLDTLKVIKNKMRLLMN